MPILAVELLFLFGRDLHASSGTIAGRVSDTTGAVLGGVTLTAIDTRTATVSSTKSDSGGRYVLADLPPGPYRIAAELAGFRRVERLVEVHVADVLTLNLALELGELTEDVRVETKPLRTEAASVGTLVRREFVENLPLNGRSFHALLELTPGVVLTRATSTSPGQFSVNGQRANANYFTVDGVSANVGASTVVSLYSAIGGALPGMTASGGTSGLVSVDALEEFKVLTSTFAPEFGRTPGAQVSIVTRSGTNAFHGTLFNYFRNDALDATDWFANRQGNRKPPLRQNDFGGVFGGPIQRNNTFFFFSYEGLRLRQPQSKTVSVPSMSARQDAPASIRPLVDALPLPNTIPSGTDTDDFFASYSDPSTLNSTSLRVDQRSWNRVTLFGRFNRAPSNQSLRAASLSTSVFTESEINTATVGTTAVLSARSVADIRGNYSSTRGAGRYTLDDFGGAVPVSPSTFVPPFASSQDGLYTFGFFNGISGWTFGSNATNPQRQLNVVASLSSVFAAHQVKVGGDYRLVISDNGVRSYDKSVVFANPTQANRGVSQSVFIASREAMQYKFRNVSVFVQDTWRPMANLSLTYGARWDYNPAPRTDKPIYTVSGLDGDPSLIGLAPEGTPLWRASKGNVAPRLGVNYVIPRTSVVVRGGAGLFYDLGYGLAAAANTGFPYVRTRSARDAAYPLSPAIEAPLPISPVPVNVALTVVRPDLRLPRTLQWNAAVERSLGPGTQISVTLLGAEGHDLIRQEYLLAPNPSFASLTIGTNGSRSDYRSLQVQVQHRSSASLSLLSAYTLGRSRDTGSDDVTSVVLPREYYELEYGPSSFDIRHSFSLAMHWILPSPQRGRFAGVLANGWSIDTMVRARSAPPVDVVTRLPVTGFQTTNLRPDLVADQPLYREDASVPGGRRINRDAFINPPSGRQGTVQRNALRGFGAVQWDASIRRDFRVRGLGVQFRADVFNVTNTPNFGQPSGSLQSAQFGVATQMLGRDLTQGGQGFNPLYQIGGPRSIQLALKLLF